MVGKIKKISRIKMETIHLQNENIPKKDIVAKPTQSTQKQKQPQQKKKERKEVKEKNEDG